jgi:hypothetical protein
LQPGGGNLWHSDHVFFPTGELGNSGHKKTPIQAVLYGGLGLGAWRFPTFTWQTATLSSALGGFTSEFGMGSGGSRPLWSPSKRVWSACWPTVIRQVLACLDGNLYFLCSFAKTLSTATRVTSLRASPFRCCPPVFHNPSLLGVIWSSLTGN